MEISVFLVRRSAKYFLVDVCNHSRNCKVVYFGISAEIWLTLNFYFCSMVVGVDEGGGRGDKVLEQLSMYSQRCWKGLEMLLRLFNAIPMNFEEIRHLILSYFKPIFYFFTPQKRQKTRCFLTFLGGIEMEHWLKIG